mmetsp:Transcript_35652/g.82334  ORF Transcript_35652/g.82334 Transcript_35652/m.82334 type:complete len:314 (+) Transcript_35652:102-1043(+)
MFPQRIMVVLDGPLIVMSLHHGFPNLLDKAWIHPDAVQLHRLLKGDDGIRRLLDREERVSEDQVIWHGRSVIHDGLVASRICLLVFAVLEVDIGHGSLGHGKLRVVGLHGPEHVQCLVDLTLLNGQLAVCHQNLHFLRGPSKLGNGRLDHLACLVQLLQLSQQTDLQREQRRPVGEAQLNRLARLLCVRPRLHPRQSHHRLEQLRSLLDLAGGRQNFCLHEVVEGMVPHAEVVAQTLLQVLQRSVRLILLVVDAGQEQIRVSAAGVQSQTLVKDACCNIHFIQGHLRFGQQDLRRYEARNESCQRLKHLNATQ